MPMPDRKTIPITLNLNREMSARLECFAKTRGLSKSAVLRIALVDYMDAKAKPAERTR